MHIDLLLTGRIVLLLWLWILVFPPILIKVKRLHFGAKGLSLPGFIFLHTDYFHESVLRHELAHQAQMRRYSPIGVALILGYYYLPVLLRSGLRPNAAFWAAWSKNPLEVEANEAMQSTEALPRVIGWKSS